MEKKKIIINGIEEEIYVVSDKEKEDNTVSYRLFGSQETNTLSKEEFIEFINKKITEKN